MQQIKIKEGFTLVELLLAIFLVGLLAAFVFSQPSILNKNQQEVSISNLPEVLQNNLIGYGELVCIKNCTQCFYFTNSKNAQNISLPMPLKIINEYILDKNNNAVKIKKGRYKDEKVCLRLKHYKNNSISQVILETQDNKFLFIPSYFGEGKEFDSLNDAVNYWIKDSDGKFRSKSEWY